MESIRPDVILGTESWLSDKIHSKEIFPDSLGFNIIRRDRKGDPHGGVIIAARHDLGLTQSFCSDKTELISGNIKIGPRKSISLNCFYRPPNKQDLEYIDTAVAEIKNLREKNKNNIFLLGGDFNLPDIDWTSYDTHSNQVPTQVNQAFIRMTADLSVQQLVNKPTRGENTLDLIIQVTLRDVRHYLQSETATTTSYY